MGSIPLRIRFDEIDGFIKVYDGIRYLVSFSNSWYDTICDKSGITDSIYHNFARIRIDSYDSVPTEKILFFDNVRILIESVVNENKNNYYYYIFLEKGLYKDKSSTEYF